MREYWVVLPDLKTVIAHTLTGEKYETPQVYNTEDHTEASPHIFSELKMNLEKLFEL